MVLNILLFYLSQCIYCIYCIYIALHSSACVYGIALYCGVLLCHVTCSYLLVGLSSSMRLSIYLWIDPCIKLSMYALVPSGKHLHNELENKHAING